ncbi:hypothetical protein SD71_04525 [Cohnella kolymensis]|uniref:Uncharacterized protein n=1 Tax=Cohnella kolymensis TaxID=1590652 RepID=A0ABR5A8P8_9BACL|nr:LytTR family DNA-binding domain-containing protein [Cohnella kolymensis]KIL36970.1 hypothetical protein SD71_04525 [Cohnella kolymensis]
MELLKVIIADDHAGSRQLLRRMLECLPNIIVLDEAADGKELLCRVGAHAPDVVLVDISMPKLSGLEAIKSCLKRAPHLQVIFITGYEKYAVEAFEISALDYIMKPVELIRLRSSLDKARQMIRGNKQNQYGSAAVMQKKLFIKAERTTYIIPTEDIIFIEKVGKKTYIHTVNKTYETADTLGAVMEKLDYPFVQSHRSYIINIERLEKITHCGDTYMIHFLNYDKPAYISKHKMVEIGSMLQ